jgi:uncharacterized protein YbjT (DUF2867 family)
LASRNDNPGFVKTVFNSFNKFIMKKALVIGGSGLVGNQLIELLLADNRYEVTALVRKKMPINHKQFTQFIFDFENPDKTLVQADEVFCCLGTTIKVAGSKPAFYKVDFEYVLSIAQIAHANGVSKFALVSSMGANKGSAIFYSKIKGAIEAAVIAVGYKNLFILRPSMLLGDRKEFRLGEKIGQALMSAISFIIPKKYKAIEARQVAKAMIVCMNSNKTGVQILESDAIADL